MKKKWIYILSTTALYLGLTSYYNARQSPRLSTVKTIIVDAGHGHTAGGGRDGAKGSYSYEDDICLDISKKLVALFRRELPDVKVVETRPDVYKVDLHQRADIANRNKGDLFISIHCNSADPIGERRLEGYRTVVKYTGKGKKRKKTTQEVPIYKTYYRPNPAKGTETYIWGAHKNGSKEEAIAKAENAAIFQEADYKEKYGEDITSQDFLIRSTLKTKLYFKRSFMLASRVQDEFVQIGRIDRDVRQRQTGIWVLQATAMPSILVETGYISNPEEEAYLNSEKGQNELTNAIAVAVKNYKKELETPRPAAADNNTPAGKGPNADDTDPVADKPKALKGLRFDV
jgi:N-acetylmuramoyl-L-alanine amidase